MQILKADTQVDVRMGPFVDKTDGFTPEAAVTLAGGGDNADEAELLKHNGAATVDISGNAWAAIAGCDGWYDLTLTAGNLDTEGLLDIVIQNDSVHLPVHARFMVINDNSYEAFYENAAELLTVDLSQIGSASIAGNAATLTLKQLDIQNNAASALVCKSTGGNGHGMDIAGNGTGEGMNVAGGATGHGIASAGGGGNTSGMILTGQGTEDGLTCVAGATGNGIECSATDGHGISSTGATNGSGMLLTGAGTEHGLACVAGATGHGIECTATSGDGIKATGATNGHGMELVGAGSGEGLTATGGATGHGIVGAGGGGNTSGMSLTGQGTENGLTCVAGATGHGIECSATDGHGIASAGATNGSGMALTGAGTEHGLACVAGATGHGIECTATSGDGINATGATNGNGLAVTGAGTGEGFKARGANAGEGKGGGINVANETTLAVRTSDTVFTINQGSTANDSYNNMVLALYDVSGKWWETRRITDYVGATKTITVDTAFKFVVAANDLVRIFQSSYAPTVAAGGGATAAEVWDYDVSGVTTQGYAGTYQQIAGGRYG